MTDHGRSATCRDNRELGPRELPTCAGFLSCAPRLQFRRVLLRHAVRGEQRVEKKKDPRAAAGVGGGRGVWFVQRQAVARAHSREHKLV